jgi:hypothetical protein
MFTQFQTLLQSKGVMKTVTDGDCFFDTMHKITGVYTKRGWRQIIGQILWKKKVLTQKQYERYLYTHEWADYTTVYEAVRHVQRPFCVVQAEYPNSVMLIRPKVLNRPEVEWTTNILYLVYDNGNHFTSFLHPTTPPELVERIKTMERVDMHEEVEGLIVTHGKLIDLLEPVNTEHFMRQYEERNGIRPGLRRTKSISKTPKIRSKTKTRKTLKLT